MHLIRDNINHLFSEINQRAKLVAVSKTYSVDRILEAYNTGHKIFGENRVQELIDKYPKLPKDIEWHLIGHLQTNKVKYIAPFISMIHSVDSLKLLDTINKEAVKNNRVIDCMLQFHIAKEETKFGLSLDEAVNLLESLEFKLMSNIRICGLMGMATFTDHTEQVRSEFRELAKDLRYLQEKYFADKSYFKELSMGMSGDYHIALEEGSTIVRIGSLIFGSRNGI